MCNVCFVLLLVFQFCILDQRVGVQLIWMQLCGVFDCGIVSWCGILGGHAFGSVGCNNSGVTDGDEHRIVAEVEFDVCTIFLGGTGVDIGIHGLAQEMMANE